MTRPALDVSVAANRRRFFLQRAMRLRTRGSGSNLHRLMAGRRSNVGLVSLEVFGSIPVMLIGAHAANAYMPPRHTKDVDFLVPDAHFADAEDVLRRAGWVKSSDLVFPNAKLGLYGGAWHGTAEQEIDIISSSQQWVNAAFDAPNTVDQNGARVLPLPFLVLMKLDSARTVDQADLGRMLGRVGDEEIADIVRMIQLYYDDEQAAEDVRQYALVGRWEYETDAHRTAADDHR